MAKKEKGENGSRITEQSKEEKPTEQHEAQRNQSSSKAQRGGTAIARREDPFRWLRHEMDTVFDRFFGRWPVAMPSAFDWDRPWGMQVQEGDNEIVVQAEAPGFEPQDFEVHVMGNTLVINAEHQQRGENKNQNAGGWEQSYRSLQRRIPLSSDVNPDNVEANYRNGILEVHLPRTQQNARRRIEVRS